MTILRRVPAEEVRGFFHDYYHTAAYAHLRLGQAFLNKFYPNVTDHELFYEEDATQAAYLIEHHYTVQAVAA